MAMAVSGERFDPRIGVLRSKQLQHAHRPCASLTSLGGPWLQTARRPQQWQLMRTSHAIGHHIGIALSMAGSSGVLEVTVEHLLGGDARAAAPFRQLSVGWTLLVLQRLVSR